jgi:hypothetical protein
MVMMPIYSVGEQFGHVRASMSKDLRQLIIALKITIQEASARRFPRSTGCNAMIPACLLFLMLGVLHYKMSGSYVSPDLNAVHNRSCGKEFTI